MSQPPPWFERRFEFSLPLEAFPNICARLRGTPARMEEILRDGPPQQLRERPGEAWSAQEHAGHLLDMEPLWLSRLGDYLSERGALTPADLTNRRTHEANHNIRPLSEILSAFRSARESLMRTVDSLAMPVIGRALPHPRLQAPMRLLDHLYFVAEHDDHHLAYIWILLHRS